MNWLASALISAIFFSAANVFIKYYQPKLGSGLGLTYFVIGGLVTTLFIVFGLKIGGSPVKHVGNAPLIALFCGAMWAIANFFFFYLFEKNAPLSIAIPLVVGGIGAGGALAGMMLFGEQISAVRIGAVALVLLGSVLLARS